MKKLFGWTLFGLFACAGCVTRPTPPPDAVRVVLTFDDALKDHLLIAAPELEARGWRGCFNIVTDWVGKDARFLTWDDVRELIRRGHEVTTHGRRHVPMTKLLKEEGEAAVRRELAASRDEIADRTGFTPRYFCAPFVDQDETIARLCREEGLELMEIPRCGFGSNNVDTAAACVADLRRAGGRRIDFLCHGISQEDHGGWSAFRRRADFVRYLDGVRRLEAAGEIVVTDYDGAKGDCAFRTAAWPRHGVVALSFDDRHFASWEAAFPLFRKYGAKATFFICGGFDKEALAFARKAQAEGHEVGLHGYEHRNAPPELEKRGEAGYWDVEIRPQLEALATVGIRPRSFAYPNTRRTDETDEVFFRHGFTRVRGRGNGMVSPTPHDPKGEKQAGRPKIDACDGVYDPAADFLRTGRIKGIILGADYQTDMDEVLRGVVRAGERGETLAILSHGIYPKAEGVSMQVDWLERLLAAAAEAGVVVRGAR